MQYKNAPHIYLVLSLTKSPRSVISSPKLRKAVIVMTCLALNSVAVVNTIVKWAQSLRQHDGSADVLPVYCCLQQD